MRAWILSAVLALIMPASICQAADLYVNARYGYSLQLPSSFSKIAEAGNGDGGISRSRDGFGELAVFGSHIMEGDFSAEVGARVGSDLSDGWTMSYVRKKAASASYSGAKGDRVLYVRMVSLCEGDAGIFRIDYPRAQIKLYDPIVKSLVRSFAPAGSGCANSPAE